MDDKKNEKNIEIKENMNESVQEETTTKEEIDFKDKYTRLLAEFSNYQKQAQTEIQSMAAFGTSKLVLKIIDILDDMEIGLMQENLGEETRGILTMVKEKITHLLALEGVKEIELKEGDNFDANKSEAIQAIESEGNSGKILQIAKKGYSMSDRIIRTAKVIVGK